MQQNRFFHAVNSFSGRKIGLGWLDGIALTAIDRAMTTDWHTHPFSEMILCIRGEKRYEFRNRPTVTLSPGSYIVIPKGTAHRVSDAIDEPGRRIGLNLRASCAPKRKFGVFEAKDYARFRRQLESTPCVPRPFPPLMKAVLQELDRLSDIPSASMTSRDYGYLRILCCQILYAATLPAAPSPTRNAKIMDEAVRWLESHAAEKVSVDRLTAFMGYSRARLFTLFKEHTGVSPSEYLTGLRIRMAKRTLTETNLSARQVALACGFSDAGYFARTFKRKTNLSPLAYRTKFRR